jgi:rhodanese-related sulfurtransferase
MDPTVEISVHDLQETGLAASSHILIDIREPWEVSICTLEPSLKLPMAELLEEYENLSPYAKEGKVLILFCHHGVRSLRAAVFLQSKGVQAFSLKGGIDEWSRRVDLTVPTY